MKEESETLLKLSNDDARNEQTETTHREMTQNNCNYKNWVWIFYIFLSGMIICCIFLVYYDYRKNYEALLQFLLLGLTFTLGAGLTCRMDVLIRLISMLVLDKKVSKLENSNQDIPLEAE